MHACVNTCSDRHVHMCRCVFVRSYIHCMYMLWQVMQRIVNSAKQLNGCVYFSCNHLRHRSVLAMAFYEALLPELGAKVLEMDGSLKPWTQTLNHEPHSLSPKLKSSTLQVESNWQLRHRACACYPCEVDLGLAIIQNSAKRYLRYVVEHVPDPSSYPPRVITVPKESYDNSFEDCLGLKC